MNMKNFILAGIAGGITDFLLGWLLYGMLFRDYFGGGEPNLGMIAGGCLFFGLLMAYVLVGLAGIASFAGGMKAGAVIGLLLGIMNNFFMRSMKTAVNWEQFAVDVVIGIVMGAIVGGVVGAINRSRPAAD